MTKLRNEKVRMMIILPAVMLGIILMIAGGASPMLWGQQAIALMLFPLLVFLRRIARKVPPVMWTCVLLMLLCTTLLFPGAGGAKRWVKLGLLNINAAMLVLPALLILISGMDCPYPFFIGAAAVLCFQPDLAQLAAFCAGAVPMFWQHRKNRNLTILAAVLAAGFLVKCLLTPVSLEPAAYCEGILSAKGQTLIVPLAGWMALALIPGFWAWRFCTHRDGRALGLALYYTATILFILTGNDPVPFVGFGLSPVAGWWLIRVFE